LGCRIGGDRFEPKAAIGERRSAPKPLIAKIFLLPKIATQSPRTASPVTSTTCDDFDARCFIERVFCEKRCVTVASCNIDNRLSRFRALTISPAEKFLVPFAKKRRMLRCSRVNTSLSGTLFFFECWCIRDGVHLDSRVHAAIKAISIGGQHGEES
jgi:hypothetical protein